MIYTAKATGISGVEGQNQPEIELKDASDNFTRFVRWRIQFNPGLVFLPSLDQPIRSGEHLRWNRQAELLGRLQTDDKLELHRRLNWQIGGVKQVSDKIWLVSFMDYDVGFFDHETGRLGAVDNPFATKVLPMCPV